VKESKSYKRARLQPRLRVHLSRFKGAWPFLVWLGAIGVLIFFMLYRTALGTLSGIVDTVAEPVAALEAAKINSIEVVLGQRVAAGDVLASMDTAVVDAEIRQIEAEMREARNSIGNFERQTLSTIKTFEESINDAQAALADLKRQQERDKAMLAQLEKQQADYDELFAKKLIDATTAYSLRPSIAGLREEIAAYPAMIAVEQQRLAEAVEARRELYESLQLRDGETIRQALQRRAEDQQAIFHAQRETAMARRETYALRAGRAGVVSRIFHHAGHIVPAGEPILRLVTQESNLVIGFLPETYQASLAQNQPAYVWRQGRSGVHYDARVVAVAPEIDTFPQRLSPLRTELLRGRRVIFELLGDHNLVPGETVQIRLAGTRSTLSAFAALKSRLTSGGSREQ